MVQYHNNILGIEVRWLAGTRNGNPGEIMNYEDYNNLRRAGKVTHLRHGGNGRTALVEFDSMPNEIKLAIVEKLGKSPYEFEQYHWFKQYIQPDDAARRFYANYHLPGGTLLKPEVSRQYYNNAIVLNALITYMDEMKSRRHAMGGRKYRTWEKLSEMINALRDELKHTLRKTPQTLQRQTKQYRESGYESLVSKKYGNDNARKRTTGIEDIIMSLYSLEHKPYAEEVWKTYTRFITGDLEIYIQRGERAGEILQPEEFYDKNGEPPMLTPTTVHNIINQYRDVVDKKRNDWLYYDNLHRPHRHRKSPQYSLSKLSMDDRDLPPLLKNSGHVKAYFVWDVGSEAILGYAFSLEKDTRLFINSLQSTFRNAHAWGLGMPIEVEVEHHLVNQLKDQLEVMFNVHFSEPGNAKEKRAEHFNRLFKYGYEKKEFPTGRFYARLETNRLKTTKVWDEEGMHEKQKKYTFKEIVSIYESLIERYNNDTHSKHKDKTRMQVLLENQNPNARELPLPVISRSCGISRQTSLRRNQYVVVNYDKYQLPNPRIAQRINKRRRLTAYYLPDINGDVNEVHLYQDDTFIATCPKLEAYQEARAERTQEDLNVKLKQDKYVAEYDKIIKETSKRIMKVGVLEAKKLNDTISTLNDDDDNLVHEVMNKNEFDENDEYYSDADIHRMAIDNM